MFMMIMVTMLAVMALSLFVELLNKSVFIVARDALGMSFRFHV